MRPADDDGSDLQRLKDSLGNNAEALAVELFGEPTRRSPREWRWGKGGSLVVSFKGMQPRFFSFEEWKGGSLLDAIMFANNCSFADAVQWARQRIGDGDAPRLLNSRPERSYDADSDEQERIDQARRIWRSGRSIAGTAAEKYLHGRELTGAWPLEAARFVSANDIEGITGWRWWRWPAVAFAATDGKGEVGAVQLVALNSDGTAARHWERDGKLKISKGSLAGTAVRFHGDQAKPLLLAEGPETAASCWQATGWETWANLGSITKAPLDQVGKTRTIIVCADDDARNAQTNKALGAAVKTWRKQGRTVLMIKPWERTRRDKSDFNDLLKAAGFDAVRQRIEAVLPKPITTGTKIKAIDARLQLAAAMDRSVQKFLAWQPAQEGDAAPFHAFKVGLGLGKTQQFIDHAIAAAKAGQSTIILAPTHKLNGEIQQRIEAERKGATVRVDIWRGREAERSDYPGETMCAELDLVRAAQRVGADVKETVCKICPQREACPYLAQHDKRADIWIAAHELMFNDMPAAMKGASLLLIDEGFALKGITGTNPLEPVAIGLEALDAVPPHRMASVQTDLAAELMPLRRQLVTAMRANGKGWLSRQALVDAGMTAELAAQARAIEWKAKVDIKIDAGTTWAGLKAKLKDADANREIAQRVSLWHGIEAVLADEGANRSGRIRIEQKETPFGSILAAQIFGLQSIRQDWRTLPAINADATMDIDLLRARVSHAELVAEIEAHAPHMTVRQVIGKTFGKRAIEHSEKLQRQVEAFAKIEAMKSGGDALLVLNKAAKVEIEKRAAEGRQLPPFLKLAHFGALAGRDQWREVAAAVIAGRPMPRPAEVELLAGILTGRAVEQTVPEGEWYPAATVTLAARSGLTVTVEAERHPNAPAEAVRSLICEGELMQAVGRVRAVNRNASNPVEVILLGNVPVPGLIPDQIEEWTPPDADATATATTGVWLSNAADQARVAGLGVSTIRVARHRLTEGEQIVTGSYKDHLYGHVTIWSELRRVAYRRLAERNGEHEAAFDPRLVGDIKAWLTEKLGPVEVWEIETGDPVVETVPELPVDPLASYHGGRLDAVQAEVARGRIRASGLRQDEVARKVGISRPQLANALQGRFGLSPDVADRLLEVIATLPQRQAVLGLDQPPAPG